MTLWKSISIKNQYHKNNIDVETNIFENPHLEFVARSVKKAGKCHVYHSLASGLLLTKLSKDFGTENKCWGSLLLRRPI